VKGSDIATCAGTPVTKAHVDASLALGKAVNVTGTPTLFINGRIVGNVGQAPAEALKGLVEFAAKQGK
jgi:protein-disulfide isomerase